MQLSRPIHEEPETSIFFNQHYSSGRRQRSRTSVMVHHHPQSI